jgi:hypothetical protein
LVPLVIVVMDDGFEVVSEQIVVFSIVSLCYIWLYTSVSEVHSASSFKVSVISIRKWKVRFGRSCYGNWSIRTVE